jgi:predicted Zn-dependent peptidase
MPLIEPRVTKLENGLTIVVIPRVGETVEVTLWIKDGSRQDAPSHAGELHMLEHMVYKGTKKLPHWRDVNQLLRWYSQDEGAKAETSYEYVQFYVRGAREQLEEMTFFLSELALRPRILEVGIRELLKEKSVIIEEHFEYKDDPTVEVEENIWRAMYRDHPLSQAIQGSPETISAIKRKDLVERWRRTFRPENMLIVIQGNVGERTAVKCVKLNFTTRKRRQEVEPIHWAPPLFRLQPFDRRVKLERQQLNKFYVAIGFPTHGLAEPNRYALWVLSRIFGEGWGSLVMTELREKHGIGYHPVSRVVERTDAGMFLISGCFMPKHLVKAIKLIQRLMRRLLSKRIDRHTLEAAKASVVADFYSWAERPDWVSEYIYYEWLCNGRDWTTDSRIKPIEKIFEAIKAVSVDDVERTIRRLFTPSKLFVSIIGPFDDRMEKEVLELLRSWKFSKKKQPLKPASVVEVPSSFIEKSSTSPR